MKKILFVGVILLCSYTPSIGFANSVEYSTEKLQVIDNTDYSVIVPVVQNSYDNLDFSFAVLCDTVNFVFPKTGYIITDFCLYGSDSSDVEIKNKGPTKD